MKGEHIMIIDLILDRKDGHPYDAAEFYRDCMQYGSVGDNITSAMDYGTEADVRQAIAEYIIRNEYNPEIINYTNSVCWLPEPMTGEELDTFWGDLQPNQYLAKITIDGEAPIWSIKSAAEIFSRIDMYDCYDEELELWLLGDKGPEPATWHGAWHDLNDPLKLSITLDSTGRPLDIGYGTDH